LLSFWNNSPDSFNEKIENKNPAWACFCKYPDGYHDLYLYPFFVA
jgi:hypothetical protein